MQSAKYNILIETGTDFALPFTVYDDNDMPMDLTDARIEAHLREFEASPDYFEFSCISNGAGGRITITLPHETTSQIPYSYGVYDVKIEFPNGSIAYPLYGDVAVRNGITKSNDGTILFLVGINSFDDLPEVGSVNRMYYDYTNRIIYRWNGQNYVSAFYGGIADIHFKEHVDEYTDCYTIVYDNGKEFDFYVTAKGVYSVEKISSEGTIFSGIVDTYRMTFNTGSYVDFQITNGRTDVEVGIEIKYEEPETLVINYTDNEGKYAPTDGKAYVQYNGAWVPLDDFIRTANVSNDSLSLPETYVSLDGD